MATFSLTFNATDEESPVVSIIQEVVHYRVRDATVTCAKSVEEPDMQRCSDKRLFTLIEKI